jgi:hypothetical protein
MRDMMPIGMHRFNRGKAARAFIKARLMDETSIMQVAEPL